MQERTMDSILSQTVWQMEKFRNHVQKPDHLERVEFSECTFHKCNFSESQFDHCIFRDCLFQDCDLNLIRLTSCRFIQTRFEKSRIAGVDWSDTLEQKTRFLKPVDFSHCVLNHCTFSGQNLKGIKIDHCTAQDVDFSDCNLSHSDCTWTDFLNSRFNQTDLTEADFTGAMNYVISASVNTLKKTKFSLPEAMSLLRSLDIILTDPENPDENGE
jgi:uncharacterized protein YjbI with pentapeptide repeats